MGSPTILPVGARCSERNSPRIAGRVIAGDCGELIWKIKVLPIIDLWSIALESPTASAYRPRIFLHRFLVSQFANLLFLFY